MTMPGDRTPAAESALPVRIVYRPERAEAWGCGVCVEDLRGNAVEDIVADPALLEVLAVAAPGSLVALRRFVRDRAGEFVLESDGSAARQEELLVRVEERALPPEVVARARARAREGFVT